MVDTREVLRRLKRRIGRERARYNRIEAAAYARHDTIGRQRAAAESNVCSLTIGFIDEELKKLQPIEEVMKAMEPCNKGSDSFDDLGPSHKGLCDDGQGNKRDRRKRGPRT